MSKTNLSKKEHWHGLHEKNNNLMNILSNLKLLEGYYHFAFFRIIKKYWSNDYSNFMEIGCAPGNYLVKFKKIFNLDVYGIEYEEEGYNKTIQNVTRYNISGKNIILGDFFDENFLEKKRESFDVVFSGGFIEHFNDPEDVVKKQASLVSKNGLLICIIPNVKYINQMFSDEKTISLHNQLIMNRNSLKDLFEKNGLDVEYCDYFGGLINFGVFGQKKNIVKIIFKLLFIFQRIILDNLSKCYFLITEKELKSRYSSPSLLCIARKK